MFTGFWLYELMNIMYEVLRKKLHEVYIFVQLSSRRILVFLDNVVFGSITKYRLKLSSTNCLVSYDSKWNARESNNFTSKNLKIILLYFIHFGSERLMHPSPGTVDVNEVLIMSIIYFNKVLNLTHNPPLHFPFWIVNCYVNSNFNCNNF